MLNQPFDAERPDAPRAPGQDPGGDPERGNRGRIAWLVALPLVLAALGLYWMRTRAPTPTPTAPGPAAEATAPQGASAAPSTTAQAEVRDQRDAAALHRDGEDSDERLRRELQAVSPEPGWQSWLASTHELIESLAVIVANVSDDEDPRRRLLPLRPASPFEVVEQGGRTIESPASARRYDLPCAVLASLDARAIATLWRRLHPLISVAYHSVGRPGISLDRAAANALKRITDAALTEEPGALQRVGTLWLYTDPDLEKRGTIEKLLQRTGPANARKLQAKARELRDALALP